MIKKLKSIIDLGCGDFNVGKDIYKHVHKYYAYDIVPDLIKTNKSQPIHCVDKKDVPKSKPMQKDKNDKEQKNELPKPDLTAAQKPMPKLSQVVVGGKKKKKKKK